MNKNTRQTKPLGRSTKEDNAGLSLLRPRLIEIIADNYVYFNEILQNIYTTIVNVITKPISPFISRLRSQKFSHCKLTTIGAIFKIRIDFKLKRPFCQPPFETRFFNRDLTPHCSSYKSF